MKFVAARLMGAALFCVLPAAAHAGSFGFETNGTRSEGTWGGEIGLAYSIKHAGVTIRPIGGVLVSEGENDRYYTDRFSNGQSRCRDSSNGQFADSENCVNLDVKPYAKLEGSYKIPLGPEIGAGGRYAGDAVRPYALFAIPVGIKARLRVNAGKKYLAAGLNFNF